MILSIPHPVRVRLGTRKHKVIVTLIDAGDEVEATAPYWSGGSRTDTWLLDRDGATFRVRFDGTVWPARPTRTPVTVTDQVAMVEGGVFCGKPASLHLFATRAWCEAMGIELP